ncbi:hypothetical protein [Leptotrichia buccalis]|uniref:Uncharacterized protein n=1 Tax=Leptotrichia buccalis (strain ATCC 14201 / DSM 1135 / JCM 12969 / NCTC 10249 / C-1013-b) TaxID=523794 RepID=C7NBT4_LEPBD|nr:hypothetical protein [Leptotrichia buccalis]ACV39615.1 hypothetical protein Lebu_1747 [Leptotrichia buccalis C-1013-b]
MKKVFFWLFYLLFLIFFDIILVIIRFNNSIYSFLESLNIKNKWILERLFSLEEIIFIIISFIFAYLISKIKVGKKSLLIPPLVIVTIKAVILFCILKYITSLDDTGESIFFAFFMVAGFGAYMGMTNLYFYLGLLFNLFRRRRNEKNIS